MKWIYIIQPEIHRNKSDFRKNGQSLPALFEWQRMISLFHHLQPMKASDSYDYTNSYKCFLKSIYPNKVCEQIWTKQLIKNR